MRREMIIFAHTQTIKQSLIQKLRHTLILCGSSGERANIIAPWYQAKPQDHSSVTPALVDKLPQGLSQCYFLSSWQAHKITLSSPSYCDKHPHPVIYLCKHPHPFINLTMSLQVNSSTPCKYYKVGYCKFGDSCYFIHPPNCTIPHYPKLSCPNRHPCQCKYYSKFDSCKFIINSLSYPAAG